MPSDRSAGTLVAEGDSWFDYPWADVVGILEDDYCYDIESVAHHGDQVEEMAYSNGQLVQLSRRIEKLLRQGRPPKAILLSGGGNDVAGDGFGMLLNHALSPIRGFSQPVMVGVIDQRIRIAYVTIIATVSALSSHWLGKPLPILTHGYDYPVPDGRGFLGGLAGPWLGPGFTAKGFDALGERIKMAAVLIDRLNDVLIDIASLPQFRHVSHVDLRRTLSNDPGDYKEYWGNELHPTKKGFRLIARKFAKRLEHI